MATTDLTNFANAPLPTFFSAEDVKQANEGLTSHASASFPVLSLNGKRFTVIRGDEQQVIMNPLDPSSTAQYIDVVLIKVPKTTAKAYYTGTYNPDDDSAKTPVCFSSTGIIPDAGCKTPQADCCADCPYNKWGSAVSVDGKATKGKACRDAVRVAIAPLGDINDPMLLRVPPTSSSPLVTSALCSQEEACLSMQSLSASALTRRKQHRNWYLLRPGSFLSLSSRLSRKSVTLKLSKQLPGRPARLSHISKPGSGVSLKLSPWHSPSRLPHRQ